MQIAIIAALQHQKRKIVFDDSLRWAVTKATLDQLDYAALVCDQRAALLIANEAAAGVLGEGDGVAVTHGRVHLSGRVDRERLSSILCGSSAERDGGTTALLARRPSGLPAYQIVLRRLDVALTTLERSARELWTMAISDPARAPRPSLRQLVSLYALTPAEARIALSLLAGDTPDEIAARTNLKIATIRSHLASLYAKTGARRQSELVRLLSSIPAMRNAA